MSAISLLLVDDHVLFREGLTGLLRDRQDVQLVGEAGDGREAVEKARELMPDLILMDIRMPAMTGLEALRQIKAEMPDTRVIMLTASDAEQDLFEAIKSGAQGYVLKNVRFEDLIRMIKGVFAGEAPISKTMAAKILDEFARLGRSRRDGAVSTELTGREKEVLRHVADGLANKAIADALGVSENTVKKHLRNILQKLHLQNRVQVAIYALREHLAGT